MKSGNKGITLVELVVSIAVMAIVGLGIGSFIYVSLQQYHAGSEEVNIQYEAQITQNKLSDMLLNAGNGISVTVSPDTVLYIYSHEEETSREIRIEIQYSPDVSRLFYTRYYLEKTPPAEGGTKEWKVDGDAKNECLASYVTGFEAVLYDKKGNLLSGTDTNTEIGKVEIHLSYQLGKKEYSSENTVMLRNTVVESSDVDTLY